MGSARGANAIPGRGAGEGEASVRREADLLEIADGGVASHVILLLDVFKF